MKWYLSDRADPRTRQIADRHYNRQKVGTPQFVPPGRCMVLLTEAADAYWCTSFPLAEYVRHKWAGAWICSAFRNENPYHRKNKDGHLSSRLITEAVAATCWYTERVWGLPIPPRGFITFVDERKVRSKEPGTCYREAGWTVVGRTKQHNLLALQLLPEAMPTSCMPLGAKAKALELAYHLVRPSLFTEEEIA